jgi:predicted peptidase
MGGTGALRLAAEHPGRFAAIAPVCPTTPAPAAHPVAADEDTPIAADGGFAPPRLGRPPVPSDRIDALARALARTPAWVFQGADDNDPTPAETRRLVAALDRVSGRVRYTEYPGVGHNVWDRAYAEPGLLPWLLAQRREG